VVTITIASKGAQNLPMPPPLWSCCLFVLLHYVHHCYNSPFGVILFPLQDLRFNVLTLILAKPTKSKKNEGLQVHSI